MNPSAKMFRELFGQDRTLTIHKSVLKLVDGNHAAALLLSQIVYWSGKETDKDGWFPKSYENWQDELFLSKYLVGKAIKVLKHLGVETKLKKSRYHDFTPTLHYRINDAKLSETLGGMFTTGSEETLQPQDSEETLQPSSIDDDKMIKDLAPEKSDAQTAPKTETAVATEKPKAGARHVSPLHNKPDVATEKPKKPRTEKQLANDAMGNAIALAYYGHCDFDKLTKSVKTNIGKVNRELREAGYKPEDVQPIHNYVANQARVGKWSSNWTINVYSTKADEWRAQQRRRDNATTAAALTTPEESKPKVMTNVFEHDERL